MQPSVVDYRKIKSGQHQYTLGPFFFEKEAEGVLLRAQIFWGV